MATLTRPKTAPSASTHSAALPSGVPAPFSQEELNQIQVTESSPSQRDETSVPEEVTRDDWEQSEEECPQGGSTNVLVSPLLRNYQQQKKPFVDSLK